MANSIHDPRYKRLVGMIVQARKDSGLTQREIAQLLRKPPSYVAKVESLQRRLDLIELVDYLEALRVKPSTFIGDAVSSLKRR